MRQFTGKIIANKVGTMQHGKCLRAIGQSLEAIRCATFELEKHGQYYEVWADALSRADDWVLRKALGKDSSIQSSDRYDGKRSLCLNSEDVLRLDAKGQKKRKESVRSLNSYGRPCATLSQQMRSVGEQLDKSDASAFHLTWREDSVSVAIFLTNGPLIIERTVLSVEKLGQLERQAKLRRRDRSTLLRRIK